MASDEFTDRSELFDSFIPPPDATKESRIKDALMSIKPLPASQRQVGGNHYRDFPIQPGEFIYKNNLGWFEGNAIKYICRHKVKGGREDLLKAIHYLELLMENEYGIQQPSTQNF